MSKKSILVVEDDKYLIEVYSKSLSKEGYKVDTALSKTEAIQKIECRTYDAALVDIMLKDSALDRGGEDVIRLIFETKKDTKVIVISGSEDIKMVERVSKMGIFSYLSKINLKSIKDVLDIVKKAFDLANKF